MNITRTTAAALALIALTGCVATSADLARIEDAYLDALESVATAEEGDREAALEAAREDLLEEIEDVREGIEARIEDVSAKVGEGPAGWIELAVAAGASALATGVGVNAHRNKTRADALKGLQREQ